MDLRDLLQTLRHALRPALSYRLSVKDSNGHGAKAWALAIEG
jgi:hypothetical protein